MPRRKNGENQVRKIGRIGSGASASYYVTLPIELVRQLGWREDQLVTVRKQRSSKSLVIDDAKI